MVGGWLVGGMNGGLVGWWDELWIGGMNGGWLVDGMNGGWLVGWCDEWWLVSGMNCGLDSWWIWVN